MQEVRRCGSLACAATPAQRAAALRPLQNSTESLRCEFRPSLWLSSSIVSVSCLAQGSASGAKSSCAIWRRRRWSSGRLAGALRRQSAKVRTRVAAKARRDGRLGEGRALKLTPLALPVRPLITAEHSQIGSRQLRSAAQRLDRRRATRPAAAAGGGDELLAGKFVEVLLAKHVLPADTSLSRAPTESSS